ncbi:Aldolase-type TIM barrel [Penicillium italicum]|uniref:Aldolase-type TIM barrel n=1 Tax=Penicillium italicum TaxID=40296 RepID=A0A0A2L4X7_PENIT|nr:Aldolase-type TIM barrel [Penicillium italicum]
MDTERNTLGRTSQFPFFVSAMGTLGSSHPGAEPLLPPEEIMDAHLDEQRLLGNQSPLNLSFQLCMPVDRTRAKSLIQRVKAAGYQSLVRGSPGSRFGRWWSWKDLDWISSEWSGPLVLKGIQSVKDVKLAVQHGVQGILLSNHGGRQIHSAPSSLMTLLEIRTYYPEAFNKLQVFVDGGLRDGADVVKALCLGATAVGVGRRYYYALAGYGAEGVERCTDILAEEF